MKKKIILLSGPVQSGKTTYLANILGVPSDMAGGFLTPDENGRRIIVDLENGRKIDFQVSDSCSEEVLKVGRFRFLESGFETATAFCLQHAAQGCQIIVVDEIGKLELRNEGFHSLVSELLKLQKAEQILFLVVRDYLLEEVIEKYSLHEAVVCTKKNLLSEFVRLLKT
jgi:nucleoside-triphosphatase THEP1